MNKKTIIKSVFILCLMALPYSVGAQLRGDFIRGDNNGDGSVSISDVTCLINYLLTGEWPAGTIEPTEAQVFTVNGVSFSMMPVEGGTFTMGATEEQVLAGAASDEYPAHQVTLSDYYIGETEVTQELWVAVMGTNPSYFTGDLMRPVEQVSWNDCQTFINQLNVLTGKTFRLPTEAEWEHAARGGNKAHSFLYSGNSNIDEVAWYSSNSGNNTHPVAEKQANELGLYDMSGNVWEWCQDYYGSSYYSNSPATNPTGPELNDGRVCRGGSWNYNSANCRVSHRGHADQANSRYSHFGFRLAL